MSTFEALLDARLRHDPGRPLVTYYDQTPGGTGERTELSVTTYANWVAKTAGVLTEDLDLSPGDRLAVRLPVHWLGPVFLGAAWLAGVEVVDPGSGSADVTVVGPALETSASGRPAGETLFCGLLPFAVPAREGVPDGVLDFGTLWPGQPDSFLGQRATPTDTAYDGRPQRDLTLSARPSDDRVLTDLVPTKAAGIALWWDLVAGKGSLVLLSHATDATPDWESIATAEHATRTEPHPARS